MHRRDFIKGGLFAVLLSGSFGCGPFVDRPPWEWRAGAARVDVTPVEPVRLSGYAARSAPSDGVEQRLFARALAFEDREGRRALVVSVDAIGVSSALTDEVASRVQASSGVPRDRFALCATHSHTAPSLAGVIPNLFEAAPEEHAAIERYTRFFVERIVEACETATKRLEPAALDLAHGTAGFAANRRTAGGPVDQDVPVLRIASPEGKIRALLFGYACHCTTLGPELNKTCGDWAGYAQEYLESEGRVAACLIGCGADANPRPRTGMRFARQHGRELADAVSAAGDFRPIRGPLSGRLARVDLPFESVPSRETLQQRLVQGPPQDRRLARMLLERIAREGTLPPALPYPIQALSLGEDLTFVFLGGEVVVDYALRLKREFDPERIWPVAYAGDVSAYIPSLRILNEGGYEGGGAMVWYGQPSRFAPKVEEIIVDQIRALVPEGLRRPPRPGPARSPVDPRESLNHFEIEPGFEIDLVAAEPHVRDPIHISWDARGRMYVTEMIDYPEGPPAGRIMRLEDLDGDGRMDRGSVFAQGLPYPTSALPWKSGVLVTCDPDILYLEDTDGDGRADSRRTLFTGFAGGNTQHRVNSLQWGLDNRVYGGNGDSAAAVKSVEHPERPSVQMTFADFRFRPDTGEFETLAEHAGYALAFDDAGARFVSSSGGDIRHVVIDRSMRDRNPYPPGIVNVHRLEGRVKLHPAGGAVERFNDPLDVGFFTAASGLTVYRGGLFPEAYRGNLFIGESAGNLVHRDVPVRQGAAYRAAPHTQPREFLASRDPWFRPVFLTTGPDGCLYIADMYRAVIEHPEWIPNDIEKTLDVRAGDDRGRIYRVRHRSCRPFRVEPLEALAGAELAERLESPNGWTRDTAQRLLVERKDKTAVERLARLAAESVFPLARLHALWVLRGLEALDPALLRSRLADGDARVREAAIRLSEEVDLAALLPLARDPDLSVRFRVADALGKSDRDEAIAALGEMIFDPANDDWVRFAAVLCRPDIAHRVLARVAERTGASEPQSARIIPFIWRLSQVVGRRDRADELRPALQLLLPPAQGAMTDWQMVGLGGGIVIGLGQKHRVPGARLRELAASIQGGDARLARAVQEAVRMAEDARLLDGTRYDALRVLAADSSARHLDVLKKYLSPKFSPELQDGAITGVSDLDGAAEVTTMLLEHWPGYAPAQRQAVMEAVFRRSDRVPALLEAVEKRRLSIAELGDGRKEQIRRHPDEAVRRRAEALLAADVRPARQQVMEERRRALELKGRRAEGLVLFARHCANCHPVQGVGPVVGPDLVRVRKRERAALLMDILDPNASVAPNYVGYNLATKDEVILSGLLAGQSPAAVTLRLPGGAERTIPRGQIEELKSTRVSLMPEMFETVLNDQDLADLIEYLRQIQ